ncbi:hypothetical protein BDN72DRAFT_100434 [Pluteus cervinus]|uniref:Uncharacterized protein n=1 Tax=Pluteus cervinus TaxID=181527 RepID=A0ACD3B8T1_9AGAR|nr:hypothetical protein BDN72DRAFT_100434 [Pluteus cervinus]
MSSILRNFSLVCRNWTPTAQSLLFSEPSLSRYAQQYQSSSLLGTLSEEPSFCSSIKSIWISGKSAWIKHDHIGLLIQLLPGLKELLLQNIQYIDLPQAARRALPSTFGSELFTTLYLTGVYEFPVTMFYHCSALQELHIHNTTFVGFDQQTGDLDQSYHLNQVGVRHKPSNQRPRLRCLFLYDDEVSALGISSWLTSQECAFDLSSFHGQDLSNGILICGRALLILPAPRVLPNL